MRTQSSGKRRIFIALPVQINKKKFTQIDDKLNKFNSILKIVPAKNYHITLKFIGEVDEKTCEDIIAQFKVIDLQIKKIELTLKGLGSFPGISRANVLWCGIKCNLNITDQLKNSIEKFTSQFGISQDDRKFKPHLTLARVKKNKKMPAELVDFFKNEIESDFGSGYFDKIILYESKLTPEGPIYTELCSLLLN